MDTMPDHNLPPYQPYDALVKAMARAIWDATPNFGQVHDVLAAIREAGGLVLGPEDVAALRRIAFDLNASEGMIPADPGDLDHLAALLEGTEG
jgi:hypothetical protein